MQIEYELDGVSVGDPKDTPGNTYIREYRGSATGNSVHVVGAFYFTGAASKGGTTWDGSIRLYDVPWPYDENLLVEKLNVQGQTSDYVPFDVWLNIPADEEYVDVRIEMEGNYANWQDRYLQLDFILENPYYGSGGGSGAGGTSDGGWSDSEGCCCAAVVLPLLATGIALAAKRNHP